MLTHGLLLAITIAYFAILLYVPFWLAVVPGVILAHRIGTLLHEYIHGIPFRRYRYNHAVVTFFDGLMLMFGTLEMFRVSHLLHHRWLNTERDNAREKRKKIGKNKVLDVIAGLEVVQYLMGVGEAIRGKQAQVRRGRMLLGAILSIATIGVVIVVGRPDMVWKMMAVTLLTMLVPVSLRAAIEHHGAPDDPHFANEYKVWIPLFNLNRHIHHHEDPTLPWYRLQWRTEQPLSRSRYVTHWLHVYVKRDYVLMRPMRASDAARSARSPAASEAPRPTG